MANSGPASRLIRAEKRQGVVFLLSIEDVSKLTIRGWEILGYLSIGMTQAEICEELRISMPTLKGHLCAIRFAFGCRSTDQAVRVAQDMGVVA